ncbi:hypothetical protein HPP92_022524 [Vanilla planifolia]|uniref:Uncharacterized protein n=1 Tax=Vanilla planifolia TaxID=51239 RepID=A0A835PTP3_VANPL|nr:hypothetical protein HPP92_022524 [Vanilla planifolia]
MCINLLRGHQFSGCISSSLESLQLQSCFTIKEMSEGDGLSSARFPSIAQPIRRFSSAK